MSNIPVYNHSHLSRVPKCIAGPNLEPLLFQALNALIGSAACGFVLGHSCPMDYEMALLSYVKAWPYCSVKVSYCIKRLRPSNSDLKAKKIQKIKERIYYKTLGI